MGMDKPIILMEKYQATQVTDLFQITLEFLFRSPQARIRRIMNGICHIQCGILPPVFHQNRIRQSVFLDHSGKVCFPRFIGLLPIPAVQYYPIHQLGKMFRGLAVCQVDTVQEHIRHCHIKSLPEGIGLLVGVQFVTGAQAMDRASLRHGRFIAKTGSIRLCFIRIGRQEKLSACICDRDLFHINTIMNSGILNIIRRTRLEAAISTLTTDRGAVYTNHQGISLQAKRIGFCIFYLFIDIRIAKGQLLGFFIKLGLHFDISHIRKLRRIQGFSLTGQIRSTCICHCHNRCAAIHAGRDMQHTTPHLIMIGIYCIDNMVIFITGRKDCYTVIKGYCRFCLMARTDRFQSNILHRLCQFHRSGDLRQQMGIFTDLLICTHLIHDRPFKHFSNRWFSFGMEQIRTPFYIAYKMRHNR